MQNLMMIKQLLLLVTFLVVGLYAQQNNSEFQRTIWDVQLSIDLSDGTGAEFDGTYFYVTGGSSNLISKYDTSGNLIESFSIPGVTTLGDITNDGNFMYGGNGSSNIYQMDFNSHLLISTINVPLNVRFIAYDEDVDGFWISSWSDPLSLVTRSGILLTTFVLPFSSLTGIGYDNVSPGGPYLWLFGRGDTLPGPQLIYQFHIPSGTFTGVTHDVLSDIGTGQPDAVSGGLFSTDELVQNTFSLGGILIGNPTILFAYEVADAVPVELVGFTGHYDGKKIILSWATATETNNQGFDIERRSATGEFQKIGYVSGLGTSTESHSYTFTDKKVRTGKYIYRLKQLDYDGAFEYSNEINVDVTAPLEFALDQNYPNPFNPTTKISWQSPIAGHQTLIVYDVLGEEVATLVDEYKPAGKYEIEFNASSLPSGIYFYQLRAGDFIQIKKMTLLR